jgi:translocation and assembly module TamB
MQILSSRGAQISPDVALDLGGTFAYPSVAGNIQIRSGFIRVPEQKKQLHPTEGTSVLWEAADSARARADTARASAARVSEDDEREPEIDTGLDLDVRVQIPGSFRIIGSRMNVELSGDLHLVQQGERPVLTGQLTPLGGQLLFMGRTFELRRGHVNFYGGDEMNPSFDLTLVTELSGYRVEIKLTGTMKDPEIELTSDPTLSESDIMSLLVFGKPMSELNTSQSGLVQQRTAEILMVYGAVKLQEQMSQQMGVDIITIQQSTRKPDESALVVGKYLNSRTLLKYEQNLENTGAYLINLEYYLTKRIKFETFIDQASETGIEINWSKDY